ncbi:HNH endonuclease signature motif containing protein [Rhodococcus sp. JG-3]|uniref:HNH endonuclease signature motif containing protein n=1 Tax=Rhodococcus sp. JG-3 TaxID=1305835 RepID=UPI00040E8CE0|nr:HNH endonuclease signature motif containing protein [Rhodococcus sp. JG-3]
MAAPVVSLEALITAAREENRHAARKIAACYDFHLTCIAQDAKHRQYSRYGRTEMALALSCSATVAEAYVSVGVALHIRLPLVKTAFEAGDIDLPRVRTVCRILDNLSDDIVKSVEGDIVEAARRSSPGPLEKEIWDILLRVAPEEAAALRDFAKKFRNVSYAPAGELARIRAELTAPEAAAAWQLLEEMADTVCVKDPRGKQERLCDAFMARMHGEPRLICLCQREDCPKKDAELPDRRVPLTMITVDIATLIGLLANPAYLAGHGSIDPDLARELARNSQWQILLTEAVTLAEALGLAVQNPETGEWERRSAESTDTTDTTPQPNTTEPEPAQPKSAASNVAEWNATESNKPPAHADTCTDTGTSTATRAAAPTDNATEKSAPADTAAPTTHTEGATKNATDSAERVDDAGPGPGSAAAQTDSTTVPTPPEPTVDDDTRQRRRNALASAAALFCTHTPIGRGARHSSALDLPSMIRSNRRIMHTPAGIYLGNASLAAALEAAIAADPTLGKSVGRDPLTDRALIYRPDALTTAAVRLRDRHCRFPGCHRPAARCQIDHVIPFDHANPLGGGWTTVNNLQCLCEYHHSVKTAGYWTAVMLPGGAILWTSTSKTTRITLPANGTTVPIIGNDLRPHIPTQPRRSGIIAYPDPPDNPTPEPEPTNEEDEEPPF